MKRILTTLLILISICANSQKITQEDIRYYKLNPEYIEAAIKANGNLRNENKMLNELVDKQNQLINLLKNDNEMLKKITKDQDYIITYQRYFIKYLKSEPKNPFLIWQGNIPIIDTLKTIMKFKCTDGQFRQIPICK